jgi:hypothetical protein
VFVDWIYMPGMRGQIDPGLCIRRGQSLGNEVYCQVANANDENEDDA